MMKEVNHSIIPFFPEEKIIPKIIHQTFPSKSLSNLLETNVLQLAAMNPGWEIRHYDDKDIIDFIRVHYGAPILTSFNRINQKYGAARADFFRYLLMYKCGGVYLDIKSSADKPLDEILKIDDRYLLSQWENQEHGPFERFGLHAELINIPGGEFQQWHIIAAPGHPFLRAVIKKVMHNVDNYNPLRHGTGKTGVLRVTGPIAYTLAIAPLLHVHKARLIRSHSDYGFRYSIYCNNSTLKHKALFKQHYSLLKESIVHLNGVMKILEAWLWVLNSVRMLRLKLRDP